MEESGIKDGKK